MLFHHPGQPPLVAVDRGVAHLRLLQRERVAQPGDLGRARQGGLQNGERGTCRCRLASAASPAKGFGRDLLRQIADSQALSA